MHSITVICTSRYRQKIIVNMINMNHKNMTIYVNLISKNLCWAPHSAVCMHFSSFFLFFSPFWFLCSSPFYHKLFIHIHLLAWPTFICFKSAFQLQLINFKLNLVYKLHCITMSQSVLPKEFRQASYAKVAQMVGNQPVSFANKPTAATDNI